MMLAGMPSAKERRAKMEQGVGARKLAIRVCRTLRISINEAASTETLYQKIIEHKGSDMQSAIEYLRGCPADMTGPGAAALLENHFQS